MQGIRVLTLIYVVIIIIIGLWPFNFISKNNVELTADNLGLLVNKGDINHKYHMGGIIFSTNNLPIPHKNDSLEIRIEVLLKCTFVPRERVGTILGVYTNDRLGFVLEQWQEFIVLRMPDAGARDTRFVKTWINNALPRDSLRCIKLALGVDGVRFFLNDEFIKHDAAFPITSIFDGASGQLVLASSPAGKNPWQGEIYSLNIYYNKVSKTRNTANAASNNINGHPSISTETRYQFTFSNIKNHVIQALEDNRILLNIPPDFVMLKKEYLSFSLNHFQLSLASMYDLIINISGFIPLGFLLGLSFAGSKSQFFLNKNYIITLIGFSLSIVIELSQADLLSRDSSLFDLILNTGGTYFGGYLYLKSR